MKFKIGEVIVVGKVEARVLRVREKHNKITVRTLKTSATYTWSLSGVTKLARKMSKLELLLRGLDEF
jgi:hypothetical protein